MAERAPEHWNGVETLKNYEALFIFDQSLDEDSVGAALTRVQEEISRQGGSVVDEKRLGRRAFARPMKKRDAGFYVRLTVQMDTAAIRPLLARLKLNEEVFRVQIVNQVVKAEPTPEPEARPESRPAVEERTDAES